MLRKHHILSLILLVACALPSKAQFSLTPMGFINPETPGKNYVVYEFPDKSQQEIYDAVVSYLYSIYVNPDVVLSLAPNSAITINALASEAVPINSLYSYNMRYTISLQVKDRRLRINAPSIVSMTQPYSGEEFYIVGFGPLQCFVFNGIFNKNGKLKNEKAFAAVQAFFNGYISNLINGTLSGADEEDW